MVRQIDLSSRTVMHSSTSLSMTSTVLQLISSRAGKGWYVTFISSLSTPGMSNLAVTCCAQKGGSKCGFDEHVDRCDPHPGTIGGLLELHTTRRKVVVSYEFAHMYGTYVENSHRSLPPQRRCWRGHAPDRLRRRFQGHASELGMQNRGGSAPLQGLDL
jgi:hypothetical protein